MSLDNLDKLLIEQVQDVYYAEKQLVKALPKMAKAATSPELEAAFTMHLAETEEHLTRLEEVFESLGVAPKAKKCPAIEGLIQEASEMIAEEGEPSVLDTGLIASAARVEHYEIAAYSALSQLAEALGHTEVMALFEETLGEELAASEKLTAIADATVIPSALAAGEMDDEDVEAVAAPAARKSAKSTAARRAK